VVVTANGDHRARHQALVWLHAHPGNSALAASVSTAIRRSASAWRADAAEHQRLVCLTSVDICIASSKAATVELDASTATSGSTSTLPGLNCSDS